MNEYLAAIARRNLLWCRWQDAAVLLDGARELGFYDLSQYVRDYNEAQQAYEWAERDLVRARVFFRAGLERAA